MSTISLIIPAHNECALLTRLLDTVDVARERFDGGSEAVEVIVVDNACTDDTANLAMNRGCNVTYVEKRCIATATLRQCLATEEIIIVLERPGCLHSLAMNEATV